MTLSIPSLGIGDQVASAIILEQDRDDADRVQEEAVVDEGVGDAALPLGRAAEGGARQRPLLHRPILQNVDDGARKVPGELPALSDGGAGERLELAEEA